MLYAVKHRDGKVTDIQRVKFDLPECFNDCEIVKYPESFKDIRNFEYKKDVNGHIVEDTEKKTNYDNLEKENIIVSLYQQKLATEEAKKAGHNVNAKLSEINERIAGI